MIYKTASLSLYYGYSELHAAVLVKVDLTAINDLRKLFPLSHVVVTAIDLKWWLIGQSGPC